MKRALDYDNVCLLPRYSNLSTRKQACVSSILGTRDFKLPVIPSNMKCVINEERAKWLSENDYMYVMHRFGIDTLEFVKRCNEMKWQNISISVGVKEDDYELIKKIKANGFRVDFITVDIAHGQSLLMKNMLQFISRELPLAFIIAGNVATANGFDDLVMWGAHAIKVGIGPGAACTTKFKTGFTYPMYSCISEIAEHAVHWDEATLIADGGIKHNGDIAKAIHAGADWVMCGKVFSECNDSPAPVDYHGNKMYYGSASAHNKNHNNNIEGTLIAVPRNGMSYEDKLIELEQDLQSSISYAGGNKLSHIRLATAVEVV